MMFSLAPAIPARSDVDWCWYLRRQGKSGEVLERILHDIGVMDPGGWAVWSHSALTPTGAPVEMVFSADHTELQLTTEVADPGSDRTGRVDEVCRIMAELGANQPPAGLRDVISAAQGSGSLTFGAWLGVRHGPDGLRCQLLAELPDDAMDLSQLMCAYDLCPTIEALGPDTRATMAVYDASTQEVTIHFSKKDASRACLPILAEPAVVCPNTLSRSIDGMTDDFGEPALPVQDLGFSYTIKGDDVPPALTLYLSAAEAFGSDAQIARRIKACGGHLLTGYVALVDGLQPAPVQHTHHGKVGLTALQNSAPILSAHVAAPWTCHFEA